MTSKTHKCSECEYMSNKIYNLKRHMMSKHSIQNYENCKNVFISCKKVFIDNKCMKCDKILSSKYYLEKHLKICKGVSNPLECHLCHKIFANKSSKSNHLKKCKTNIEIKKEELVNININIYVNNIVVFDIYNINGSIMKKEHINLEFIRQLLKIKENDALTLYIKKILENPENRCIKKTNIRSMISEVHIGENKWVYYHDNIIYPKFISEISDCFIDLLKSKITDTNIIRRLIEYLDYMSDEGYCNNENISKYIKKCYKAQIQNTKLLVYDMTKSHESSNVK